MSTIAAVIDEWRNREDWGDCIVWVEHAPERPPTYARTQPVLPPGVTGRLAALGIDRIYAHQAEAIDKIREGTHTVIATGTASGKSLAYQLPIAAFVEEEPIATGLALFPTKALARDQLGAFHRIGGDALTAAVYDGDTPREERPAIRRSANVVLTNPDMLHIGILPNHDRWKHFLARLRIVVVDEIHSFKGIFGSHVGLVLRRLRRLAAHHGADPTFVFTSATIGNPGELASRLSGLPVEAVDGDGAPAGDKYFVLWNPELDDPERGIRASPLTDATRLFADLVERDLHTIVFARSRKASELVYRWTRDRLDAQHAAAIASYRAGYLPADRRRIEADLFAGRLLGVAATNALELGIDVGGLDAAIITTFPGTIASFRQQAGRSGRRKRASLAVLVAGHDALDQHYMHHPEDLFAREAEAAVVNPDNPSILESHIACAAHELPLVPGDAAILGSGFEALLPNMVGDGRLGIREGRLYWAGGRTPARAVNIRTAGGSPYQIIAGSELIGTVDEGRAFTQCHPGAVYLHQGDGYVVDDLDLETREVRVHRTETGYYTQPKVDKDLSVEMTSATRTIDDVTVAHGTVEVVTDVIAYQRRSITTGEVLETRPLHLPTSRFSTQAVWYEIPQTVVDAAGVEHISLPGTLHAAEHTAIAMLPLFAICDRWDVGGLSIAHHPQLGVPAWFIYDGYPGGAGIAPIAYERVEQHLRATLQALEECPCAAGCPSCVQSPKCGNYNEPLDKDGAVALLREILQ